MSPCLPMLDPISDSSASPHSGGSAPTRRRAPWAASFLLALVVYAAFRGWILATAFDSVAIPVYEIPTIGSYSWTLFHGVSLLEWSEHYDNAGAQILTSWLGALSYALFGASYLALKLVPMTMGVVLLAMVGRMLARNFSGRAALFGMLSVAVAPPIVTKYSMLAKGNHFEGLTLLFLVLLLALEVPEPRGPRRRLMVAATGGALGFAISMYFGAMLAGVVVTLVWWTRFGLVQGLRDLPIFAASMAVGLVPFVVINVGTAGRAGFYGAGFGSPTTDLPLSGVLAKAKLILHDTLPDAACFEGVLGMAPRVAESVLLVLTVLSWCGIALGWLQTFRTSSLHDLAERRRRRAAAVILLSYPIGVLGVLTLKGLPIMPKTPPVEILGVRYLLGYYFFSLLLIAAATDRWLRSSVRVIRGLGALAGLALLFTWPFTAAIALGNGPPRADALHYPGVHFRQYAILFRMDLKSGDGGGVDTTRMKAALEELSGAGHDDKRSELAMGIGSFLSLATLGYGDQGAQGGAAFSLDAILLDFEERDRADLLRGVGMYFNAGARARHLRPKNGKASKMRREIDHLLENEADAHWIAEGFGMTQKYPLLRMIGPELQRSRNLLAVVPDTYRIDVLRGIAGTLDRYRALQLGLAEPAIERQVRHFDAADRVTLEGLLQVPLQALRADGG